MNKLIEALKANTVFSASISKCEKQIVPILQRYLTNFPEYTDHTMDHSRRVLDYAANILGENIAALNPEEIYILVLGTYLHDIGMATRVSNKIKTSGAYKEFKKQNSGNFVDYVRKNHQKFSSEFVLENWHTLGIIGERYAKAVADVAMGHREENLFDYQTFNPKYPVKSGTDFVCIPFLAGILRIADELDITNDRTPDLLCNKYLPKNKVSKGEWLKHRNTYLVNFDEAKIIITAESENKELYLSLVRQMEKVQESIDAFLKLMRHLPTGNRHLKIDYTRVEPNIKSVNFDPKTIKFTFDLPNMFETVIGKRIYGDKFAAVREAVQNSIDACLYRKSIAHEYSPKISITVGKSKLVIVDNGLGMDEFIVENFFARLGKSFYMQENVSKGFEGISEFGIGVFSYFMLGDCFDVETKMPDKSALKFRVVKDASVPFHFYTDATRVEPGTTLTMFLQEPIGGKELEDYLRNHIAYVDIPMELSSASGTVVIQKQKFEVSEKEALLEVVEKIKHYELPNMGIIKEYINTEQYEGVCWLLLARGKGGKLLPNILTDQVDRFREKIKIYNKGIYVRALRYETPADNLFGSINFKKKLPVTISRDSFSNYSEIQRVLSEFLYKLVDKMFKPWETSDDRSKAAITSAFLGHMVSRYSMGYNPDLVVNYAAKYFCLKVYRANKIEYVPMSQFLKNNKKFLVCQDDYTENSPERIRVIEAKYNKTKLPVVIVNPFDDGQLLAYYLANKHRFEIDCAEDESTYVVYSKSFRKRHNLGYFEVMPMNSKWITDILKSYRPQPLNSAHKIVRFIVKNQSAVKSNSKLQLAINQFLKNLHSFIFDVHEGKNKNSGKELDLLNASLSEINKLARVKFKLSEVDFPARFNIKSASNVRKTMCGGRRS